MNMDHEFRTLQAELVSATARLNRRDLRRHNATRFGLGAGGVASVVAVTAALLLGPAEKPSNDHSPGRARIVQASDAETGPAAQQMHVFSEPAKEAIPPAAVAMLKNAGPPPGTTDNVIGHVLSIDHARVLFQRDGHALYGIPTDTGGVCYVSDTGAGGCLARFNADAPAAWVVGKLGSETPVELTGPVSDEVTAVQVESDGAVTDAQMGPSGYVWTAPDETTRPERLVVELQDGNKHAISLPPAGR